jgi:XTP/dITP diphosphohydrolase
VTLILATRNAHKLAEVTRILGKGWIEPLPERVELGPEIGETFAQNALGKARAAAAATGRAVIADDSGIEAAALGGAPGVRSARFAGEHAGDAENLALLISRVPPSSGLTYVCALAYLDPDAGIEQLFEGRCEGHMARAPRGNGGFGYDPVFVPVEEGPQGRTMAELGPAEKDAISHRGRALRMLAGWLAEGHGRG